MTAEEQDVTGRFPHFRLFPLRQCRKEQGADKKGESERSAGSNYARNAHRPESATGTTRRKWSPDVCASMAPSDQRIIA